MFGIFSISQGAIAQYLEDMADTALAVDRIENSEERVSMEETKKILDLK